MNLEQLSNAFGVSSVEDEVRKIIVAAAQPYADSWRADTMGNLFFTRRPRRQTTTQPLRVMVTAHMDEVGFIISQITKEGLLKFKPIGGFDPRVLLGKRVVVGPAKIPGIIGLKPGHLVSGKERNRVDSIKTMYIDTGATDDKTNRQIKVGDFATFATQFGRLGGQARHRRDRGLVKGKAFDNRAGCAVLLELLKEDYPLELIAVFTVQEEIGLRGARAAAYQVDPDLAFVLEATPADDLPRQTDDAPEGFPRLGEGAVITLMDRSFIADRRLVDLLISTAEREAISYQFKRPGLGGTDAGAVHLTREGVPSGVVSVPTRYIHAPAAVLNLADFWRVVALMRAVLHRLPEQAL